MGNGPATQRALTPTVDQDLEALKRFSDKPMDNLQSIREVIERLNVVRPRMNAAQLSQYYGFEETIFTKLKEKDRTALYEFKMPPGHPAIDLSKVTDLNSAIAALRIAEKDPLYYLREIRQIYTEYGVKLQGQDVVKREPIVDRIYAKLTLSQVQFVNSTPLELTIPRIAEEAERLAKRKPGVLPPGSMGDARGGPSMGMAAPTDQDLLPPSPRWAGTPAVPVQFTLSEETKQVLGWDKTGELEKYFSKMYDNYFQSKTRDAATGNSTLDLFMQRIDVMTGGVYKDSKGNYLSLDVKKTPQEDTRWNALRQLLGPYDPTSEAGRSLPNGQFIGGRQQMLDVLNLLKKGDFLAAAHALPTGSPLKEGLAKDIAAVTSRLNVELPLEFLTLGVKLPFFRLVNARLKIGGDLLFSQFTTEQMKVDFNQQDFSLKFRYAGTTGERLALKGGAFARWEKLYGNAFAEFQVGGEALQAANRVLGEPALYLSGTLVDPSGWKIPLINMPLYWGLKLETWPTVKGQPISVTAGVGIGVLNLKGTPVVILADLGAEFRQDAPNTPKSLSNLLWRVGPGTTLKPWGKPLSLKLMYVQGTKSTAGALGVQNESQIGGALEAKMAGWRLGLGLTKTNWYSMSGLEFPAPRNFLFNAHLLKEFF